MKKITEIIPNDMPDWAREAMANGQFFNVACENINRHTLLAIIERYDRDSDCFLSEAKRHYDLMEELKELAQIPDED